MKSKVPKADHPDHGGLEKLKAQGIALPKLELNNSINISGLPSPTIATTFDNEHARSSHSKRNNKEEVFVHALIDPRILLANIDGLRKAFLEAIQPRNLTQCEFHISESSGWISFTVNSELWGTTPESALNPKKPSRKKVERLAESYLQKIRNALRVIVEKKSISILPELEFAELVLVPRPVEENEVLWDHWLYRTQPVIPLAKKMAAPVFGTLIELRLGADGQLIGFHSRWRPLSGEVISVPKVPFSASQQHREPDGHKHEEKNDNPIVQYVFDGDCVPQHYLAPYYFTQTGHHFSITSASSYSLVVEVFRTGQSLDKLELTTVISGGSGSYEVNWATYTLPGLDEGLVERVAMQNGDGTSTITIEAGQYIVLLNVMDTDTGAFKHHQQQVFSSPSEFELVKETHVFETIS